MFESAGVDHSDGTMREHVVEDRTISFERLLDLLSQLFAAWGFCNEDSAILARLVLEADLRGIDTHGIQRLPFYRRIIRDGHVHTDAKPTVVRESAVSAVVDAKKTMGHLAARHSMQLAIAKAQETGIGIVATRNSNHFGIAGCFAQMASEQGLVGICCTNSYPIMPATFGDIPVIGSNPLAFAFPSSPLDFLYDASSTVVSLGKVELSAKLGQQLEMPWGMDENGAPTTDPQAVLGASPTNGRGVYGLGGPGETNGGHKGYGQGLIVEILTAILSGGMTALDIAADGGVGASHFFGAFNPELFGSLDLMRQRLGDYFEQLRHSNRHTPNRRIYLHGEKEAERRTARLHDGLCLAGPIYAELESLLVEANVCD
jgi:LDH2 family malate/lactate/ureidoglycolate dehydrogenase